MGRRKNLKDLSPDDELLITEKMNGNNIVYKEYTNGSSALNYKVELKCKNQKQKDLCKLIKEKEIVFCAGSAGSGKSYTTLSMALQLLRNDELPYKNITFIAQTVQAELDLGYLKGSLEDKIGPFLEPTWYNIKKIFKNSNNTRNDKEILDNLIKSNLITYNHVAFLRGANIDNSIVIIDEAQQYSKSAMKTILTRIGTDSKYIFMGDIEQCDNKELKKTKEENGLKYCMRKLKNIENIGIIEFTNEDIVRNPIISIILQKFNE